VINEGPARNLDRSRSFIGANPPDTKLVPISRTVGTDSLVDEMLFSFTHTSEIDWMLPGVPPTGRKVEVPVVARIALAIAVLATVASAAWVTVPLFALAALLMAWGMEPARRRLLGGCHSAITSSSIG
jgi:hypothetical protein